METGETLSIKAVCNKLGYEKSEIGGIDAKRDRVILFDNEESRVKDLPRKIISIGIDNEDVEEWNAPTDGLLDILGCTSLIFAGNRFVRAA